MAWQYSTRTGLEVSFATKTGAAVYPTSLHLAVTIPTSAAYMPTLSSGETGNCSSLTFSGSGSTLNFTGGNLIVAGAVNFSSE